MKSEQLPLSKRKRVKKKKKNKIELKDLNDVLEGENFERYTFKFDFAENQFVDKKEYAPNKIQVTASKKTATSVTYVFCLEAFNLKRVPQELQHKTIEIDYALTGDINLINIDMLDEALQSKLGNPGQIINFLSEIERKNIKRPQVIPTPEKKPVSTISIPTTKQESTRGADYLRVSPQVVTPQVVTPPISPRPNLAVKVDMQKQENIDAGFYYTDNQGLDIDKDASYEVRIKQIAKQILERADYLWKNYSVEVGFPLYTSHYRTLQMHEAYKNNWETGINKYEDRVAVQIEKLLKTDFIHLQTKFKFLPITAWENTNEDGVEGETKEEWIRDDLRKIEKFMQGGGAFLGLKPDLENMIWYPSHLPKPMNDLIQTTMSEFEHYYGYKKKEIMSHPMDELLEALEDERLLKTYPLNLKMEGIDKDRCARAVTQSQKKLFILELIINEIARNDDEISIKNEVNFPQEFLAENVTPKFYSPELINSIIQNVKDRVAIYKQKHMITTEQIEKSNENTDGFRSLTCREEDEKGVQKDMFYSATKKNYDKKTDNFAQVYCESIPTGDGLNEYILGAAIVDAKDKNDVTEYMKIAVNMTREIGSPNDLEAYYESYLDKKAAPQGLPAGMPHVLGRAYEGAFANQYKFVGVSQGEMMLVAINPIEGTIRSLTSFIPDSQLPQIINENISSNEYVVALSSGIFDGLPLETKENGQVLVGGNFVKSGDENTGYQYDLVKGDQLGERITNEPIEVYINALKAIALPNINTHLQQAQKHRDPEVVKKEIKNLEEEINTAAIDNQFFLQDQDYQDFSVVKNILVDLKISELHSVFKHQNAFVFDDWAKTWDRMMQAHQADPFPALNKFIERKETRFVAGTQKKPIAAEKFDEWIQILDNKMEMMKVDILKQKQEQLDTLKAELAAIPKSPGNQAIIVAATVAKHPIVLTKKNILDNQAIETEFKKTETKIEERVVSPPVNASILAEKTDAAPEIPDEANAIKGYREKYTRLLDKYISDHTIGKNIFKLIKFSVVSKANSSESYENRKKKADNFSKILSECKTIKNIEEELIPSINSYHGSLSGSNSELRNILTAMDYEIKEVKHKLAVPKQEDIKQHVIDTDLWKTLNEKLQADLLKKYPLVGDNDESVPISVRRIYHCEAESLEEWLSILRYEYHNISNNFSLSKFLRRCLLEAQAQHAPQRLHSDLRAFVGPTVNDLLRYVSEREDKSFWRSEGKNTIPYTDRIQKAGQLAHALIKCKTKKELEDIMKEADAFQATLKANGAKKSDLITTLNKFQKGGRAFTSNHLTPASSSPSINNIEKIWEDSFNTQKKIQTENKKYAKEETANIDLFYDDNTKKQFAAYFTKIKEALSNSEVEAGLENLRGSNLRLISLSEGWSIDNIKESDPDTLYSLELMSNLPEDNKPVAGKIYVSPNGRYLVLDPQGNPQEGSLKEWNIDLRDLSNRLQDEVLKMCILDVTSQKGHTQTKNPLEVAKTTNTPILIEKEGKFQIYAKNAENKWGFIDTPDSEEIVALLNELFLKPDLTINKPNYLSNRPHYFVGELDEKIISLLKSYHDGYQPRHIGNKLSALLQENKDRINNMSVEEFINLLMKGAEPRIYAENFYDVKRIKDKQLWTENEMQLLGDVVRKVSDVTVYTTVTYKPQKEHMIESNHPRCDMLFIDGALLTAGNSVDKEQILVPLSSWDGEGKRPIDRGKLKKLLMRRLLPGLIDASNSHPEGTIITTPTLGGAAFAGEYKNEISELFPELFQEIVRDNIHLLPNIKAIVHVVDPTNPQSDKENDKIDYITSPSLTSTIPYIRTNRAIGFCPKLDNKIFSKLPKKIKKSLEKCATTAMIAGDRLSYPGNDFYEWCIATHEAVAAAYTNLISKVTKLKGEFKQSFKPRPIILSELEKRADDKIEKGILYIWRNQNSQLIFKIRDSNGKVQAGLLNMYAQEPFTEERMKLEYLRIEEALTQVATTKNFTLPPRELDKAGYAIPDDVVDINFNFEANILNQGFQPNTLYLSQDNNKISVRLLVTKAQEGGGTIGEDIQYTIKSVGAPEPFTIENLNTLKQQILKEVMANASKGGYTLPLLKPNNFKSLCTANNIKLAVGKVMTVSQTNSNLYNMGKALLEIRPVTPDLVARQCALAIALRQSKVEEDRPLGHRLVEQITPDIIEKLRQDYPGEYYLQLCLAKLSDLKVRRNDDERKEFIEKIETAFKEGNATIEKLKHELTFYLGQCNNDKSKFEQFLKDFIKLVPHAPQTKQKLMTGAKEELEDAKIKPEPEEEYQVRLPSHQYIEVIEKSKNIQSHSYIQLWMMKNYFEQTKNQNRKLTWDELEKNLFPSSYHLIVSFLADYNNYYNKQEQNKTKILQYTSLTLAILNALKTILPAEISGIKIKEKFDQLYQDVFDELVNKSLLAQRKQAKEASKEEGVSEEELKNQISQNLNSEILKHNQDIREMFDIIQNSEDKKSKEKMSPMFDFETGNAEYCGTQIYNNVRYIYEFTTYFQKHQNHLTWDELKKHISPTSYQFILCCLDDHTRNNTSAIKNYSLEMMSALSLLKNEVPDEIEGYEIKEKLVNLYTDALEQKKQISSEYNDTIQAKCSLIKLELKELDDQVKSFEIEKTRTNIKANDLNALSNNINNKLKNEDELKSALTNSGFIQVKYDYDIDLIALENGKTRQSIEANILNSAQNRNTPILIKEGDTFFLYCKLPQGRGRWDFTSIGQEYNGHLNSLSFDTKTIKRGELSLDVVKMLKKYHADYWLDSTIQNTDLGRVKADINNLYSANPLKEADFQYTLRQVNRLGQALKECGFSPIEIEGLTPYQILLYDTVIHETKADATKKLDEQNSNEVLQLQLSLEKQLESKIATPEQIQNLEKNIDLYKSAYDIEKTNFVNEAVKPEIKKILLPLIKEDIERNRIPVDQREKQINVQTYVRPKL